MYHLQSGDVLVAEATKGKGCQGANQVEDAPGLCQIVRTSDPIPDPGEAIGAQTLRFPRKTREPSGEVIKTSDLWVLLSGLFRATVGHWHSLQAALVACHHHCSLGKELSPSHSFYQRIQRSSVFGILNEYVAV